MARGNIYILIRSDKLNEQPPEKTKERYTYTDYIYDQNGNIIDTTVVVPTWEQLAGRQEQSFGLLRNNIYVDDGLIYYLIEFQTSFVKGELNQLLSVGTPANFPHGAILAADEAAVFLSDGAIDEG